MKASNSILTEAIKLRILIFFVLASLAHDSLSQEFEELCGTPSSQVADAWQQTWLELGALEQVSKADAWTNAPQRVGYLLRNVSQLQRASVGQGQKVMEHARATLNTLNKLRPQMIEAAQRKDDASFSPIVAEAKVALGALQSLYPTKVLNPVLSNGTVLIPPSNSGLRLTTQVPLLATNQRVDVNFYLKNEEGKGVGPVELLETHTRRLHALVIDSTLEDYHHEHPIASGSPGQFRFSFTPQKPGSYVFWLDATPAATRRNELVRVVLPAAISVAPPLTLTTNLQFRTSDLRFELRLDRKTVQANQLVNATLRVTDHQGRPVFNLEPIMGAFAHVIGFMGDLETAIHVHSLGEPPRDYDRSGPEVPFRFIAPKSGHIKFFVQTQLGGTVKLASFSFPVK